MIRLLLVDDQILVRQGLRSLLDAMPDMVVVGEAENGEIAVEQVAVLQPDLVLMDVRMPMMDGVVATQKIQQQYPDVKILVLTTFDDDDYIRPAMDFGAMGYLLKDTPADELTQAIRSVHKGYTQLGPGLYQKAIAKTTEADTGVTLSSTPLFQTASPLPPPSLLQELTAREQEVLALIAQGASNREIAQQLYISEKTVKNHITHILGRLNLRDRTQAAIFAHACALQSAKD